MAVFFRVTGTWAELTADGPVAIPATPQAGDRMYLFARWKDFSVTAQVSSPSGWNELVEFADGAVSAGNGTGSVKVACWYRDWQSGDTDPTIDFSASPDNASVVIMVMAKGATDTWLTPVAVTAAMTNWTTTSQIVAASATANVLGGGVVMGLIGLRDDSAVMTRPANGIDDSAGAITWNGNYVESPATHHSTTTGFDGAADLGYRLVTTGATATLRMTGTISAAETGAALWVVQGVEFNLTVQDAAHVHSTDSLTLTQTHVLTVADGGHAHTAQSLALTQVHEIVIQGAQHAHTANNLILTQAHILATQDASHAHAAGNLTIEVVHHLVIQGADHASLSDTPTLELVHHLEVNNSAHTHTVESVILAQVHELLIDGADHLHTAQSPNVRTFQIVFLDPGGDAVQDKGYFHSIVSDESGISFDNTQKVAGVGSYKFDSGASLAPTAALNGILGPARRISFDWRCDSVPNIQVTTSQFCEDNAIFSGGGFTNPSGTNNDDGVYATATPARNAGQGSKMGVIGAGLDVPAGSLIVSVKIIYERKYDIDTSIGISRVKWLVNGEEGPDHDNTDMPLTDTVVEVDVTGDRFWEPQDLQLGVFEVIGEARRGDTDTEHTQSWDYVKVEVVYHQLARIVSLMSASNQTLVYLAAVPKGDGVQVRFVDGAGNSFGGITELAINQFNRISFAYVLNGLNDLDIQIFINGIPELLLDEGHTGDLSVASNLQYGWIQSPGVDHLCWFDQLYIDDGDDLQDPGNALMTAKLPATINENDWNATIGTGAVNERALSETNGKQHTASTGVRQTYTIQDAGTGDVDISSESLLGYMGWAWAKRGSGDDGDLPALIVNNVVNPRILTTTPALLKSAVASTVYPSHSVAIGMRSNEESADTFMYECGVVVAYEGPLNPDILLPRQEVSNETLDTIIDDLRADPPDSYELCWQSSESDTAIATLSVSVLHSEGGEPQHQTPFSITGSSGRMRVEPGLEVRIDLNVTDGSTYVALWRRVNSD